MRCTNPRPPHRTAPQGVQEGDVHRADGDARQSASSLQQHNKALCEFDIQLVRGACCVLCAVCCVMRLMPHTLDADPFSPVQPL